MKKYILFSLSILLFSCVKATHTRGNFQNDTSKVITVPLNLFKVVYFGSSVPYGQGATNRFGYTSIYSEILNSYKSDKTIKWETANISVPGDNTIKVLNRYNKDLLPQKSKYVMFALSLGNEGIHDNGKVAFDQFKENIQLLITKARNSGFVPIISNSYGRNIFNKTDYGYVKEMNLFIHQLDVPSVNLLGAVDDLQGHWASGYWLDGAHPNDQGHLEMAYSLVPSLFDALNENKELPKKVESSSVIMENTNSQVLSFKPENIIHSFTIAFTFKSSSSGKLLKLTGAGGNYAISVENNVLKYNSINGKSIVGKSTLNDAQWHTIILTHYYAKGITNLYCDNVLQGSVDEKTIMKSFEIGGSEMPQSVFYKDLMFWRSGMNAEEANYISTNSLLKSSLELYAPLNGGQKKPNNANIINLAQSQNKLILIQ